MMYYVRHLLCSVLFCIVLQLLAVDGVEKEVREVEVSASGFQGDKIIINVSVHFKAESNKSNELSTLATNVIAEAIRVASSSSSSSSSSSARKE